MTMAENTSCPTSATTPHALDSYIGRTIFGDECKLGFRQIRSLISSYGRIMKDDTCPYSLMRLERSFFHKKLISLRKSNPEVDSYVSDLIEDRECQEGKFAGLFEINADWNAEKKEEDSKVDAILGLLAAGINIGCYRTFEEIEEKFGLEIGPSETRIRPVTPPAGYNPVRTFVLGDDEDDLFDNDEEDDISVIIDRMAQGLGIGEGDEGDDEGIEGRSAFSDAIPRDDDEIGGIPRLERRSSFPEGDAILRDIVDRHLAYRVDRAAFLEEMQHNLDNAYLEVEGAMVGDEAHDDNDTDNDETPSVESEDGDIFGGRLVDHHSYSEIYAMEPSSSSFASTSEQAATTSSSAPSLEQPTTTPSSPPEPMVWGPDYDTKMQSYIGRCVFGTNHRLGIREVRALLSSYRISRQDTIIACLDTTCYASTLQQLRRQFPQVKTYLIDLTAKKKEEDDRFDTLTSSFHGWAAEKKEEEEELRAVIKILRSYCLGSQRTFKEIIEHAREKESRGRIRAMMSGALPRVATTPTMTTTGRRNRFSEPPRRPFTASDIARYSPNARPTAVHRMPRGELANAGIPPNARPGDWFTMSYQGRGVLATIRPPAGDRIDYDLLNAEPSWVHQPEQGHVVDPRQGSVTVGDGDGNRDDRTGQTVATATNLIRELGEMREQLRDMREEANSLSAAARQLLSTGGSDRRPTTVDIVTGAIVPVSSTSAGNLASRNIVMAQRQREQQEREQQELLAAIERSLVDFNAQNSGGQGSSSSAQGGSAGDQEPSQSTIPGSTLQGDPPAPAA